MVEYNGISHAINANNNNNNINYIEIYIKLAYTEHTITYEVNNRLTTYQFIDEIRPRIQNDFNLNNFDLILMGQNNENVPSEEGEIFVVNGYNIDLESIRDNNGFIGFYIKPNNNNIINNNINNIINDYNIINNNQISHNNLNNHNDLQNIHNNYINLECIICYNNRRNTIFIPCNHVSCCTNCAFNELLINCPLCRSYINQRQEIYF
jgi:hypothetical protein